MSESPQRHETGHIRTELIACSTLRAVWIISLLDALARYPFSHDTYFSEFDTIPIGQPIDRNRSPFSAILLVQPNEGELASLGTIDIALDETIFVLQVIGIYDTECDFAVERGGEALYSELRARASLRLDDLRKAVA
jgi:hypothetical protein